MNLLWKWSMYIMSYVPLYLLILLQHSYQIIVILTKRNIVRYTLRHPYSIGTFSFLLILIAWSLFVYIMIIKTKTFENEQIGKYEDAGEGTLNYLATFIVPLISLNVNNPETLLTNLVLFIILGQLYTMGDLLYLNPVFTLFGYHVIRDRDKGNILFSRIPITQLHQYGESNLNKIQVATLGYTNMKVLKKVIIGEND